NMRADRNIVLSSSWTNAEDIAHVVAVNILKPKVNKFLCQPFPARPFPKWRRRNACHLQLPRRELRFLQAKPGKRVANFGQSCKPAIITTCRMASVKSQQHSSKRADYDDQSTCRYKC